MSSKFQLTWPLTLQTLCLIRLSFSNLFDEVVMVDVMDSEDQPNLFMLGRPELGITFTKIHCWTLTQYSKCVFLNADTLVSSLSIQLPAECTM